MEIDTRQLSESLSLKIDTNKLKDLLDSVLNKLSSHDDRLFTIESQLLGKADYDKVLTAEKDILLLKECNASLAKRAKNTEQLINANRLSEFDQLIKNTQISSNKLHETFQNLENDFKVMKIDLNNYYMLNMNLEANFKFIQQDLQTVDSAQETQIQKINTEFLEMRERFDFYEVSNQKLSNLCQNNLNFMEDYKTKHLEAVDELKRKIVHIETITGLDNPQPKAFSLLAFKKLEPKETKESKETIETHKIAEKEGGNSAMQLMLSKTVTDITSSLKVKENASKATTEVQIGSLKRRLRLIEDSLIKMNIPADINFTHFIKDTYSMKEQYQTIFNNSKQLITQIDRIKKIDIPKDIVTLVLLKDFFSRYEEMLLSKISEIIDDMTRNYADKKTIKRSFRYLENIIFEQNSPTETLDDKAIATKKPLGKISCLSCQTSVGNLQGTKTSHTSWSKLRADKPGRHARGFSQMLSRVKVDQSSSLVSTVLNSAPSCDGGCPPKKIWRPNSSFHA